VTVIKDGYHGDTSIMVGVGDIAPHAERLIKVTQECLYKAIAIVKPGTTLGDIGAIIQEHAEKHYYSVVREYCGHGIGAVFHEDPQVLHYGRKGEGMVLKPGMTFTIEPMINAGKRHTKLNTKDGWTVTTKDGRLSAQWEHTLGVTDTGVEIFTLRSDDTISL
jgi:methionyl aminopeptidase